MKKLEFKEIDFCEMDLSGNDTMVWWEASQIAQKMFNEWYKENEKYMLETESFSISNGICIGPFDWED